MSGMLRTEYAPAVLIESFFRRLLRFDCLLSRTLEHMTLSPWVSQSHQRTTKPCDSYAQLFIIQGRILLHTCTDGPPTFVDKSQSRT